VIAASTVEELQLQVVEADEENTVCYFFFRQQDPTKAAVTRLAAYRAIAAQIFQEHISNDAIYNIYSLASHDRAIASTLGEILDTLKLAIPLCGNFQLILDGIDECSANVKLLADLCEIRKAAPLKVIFLSRPSVAPLQRMMGPEQILTLERSNMSRDIHTFLSPQVKNLAENDRFPNGADIPAIEDEITKRADGMFLWARLMMKYLDSPALTKEQRLATIFEATPMGLQQMYDRIFQQILSMDPACQQLARRAFAWASHARWKMDTNQFSEAVYPTNQHGTDFKKGSYFDTAVIIACCGLLEKRSNGDVSFIHQTAKEYVMSSKHLAGHSPFIMDMHQSHLEIGRRCISYMFGIPLGPLSGDFTKPASVHAVSSHHPLLRYATHLWPAHLHQGFADFDDPTHHDDSLRIISETVNRLEHFLKTPLSIMCWIEAAWLLNRAFPIDDLDLLAQRIESAKRNIPIPQIHDVANDLSELHSDLQTLLGRWSKVLLGAPHDIWSDIPAFNPSRFLAQRRGISMDSLSSQDQSHTDENAEAMFCISRSSLDGSRVGKLSVWSSA
jgi:hypothetical protein